MKIVKYIAAGIIALGMLGSCDSFLDVMPDNRTELNSPEKIAKMLVSAYSVGYPFVMFEYMSDNVTDNGTDHPFSSDSQQESYFWDVLSTTTQDGNDWIWSKQYDAISAANTALEAIEALGYPDECKPHMAEALLCRAYGHFVLANTFCLAYNEQTSSKDLGIPYIVQTEDDLWGRHSRGTVKEVWDKINADIEAALPYVDDIIYSQAKFHFNKKAAYAFAAEFNLYYGNYRKTIEYATEALGNNPASVLRSMVEYRSFTTTNDVSNWYIRASMDANLMLQPVTTWWGRYYSSSSARRYGQNRVICQYQIFWSYGPWNPNGVLDGLDYAYGGTNQSLRIPKLEEKEESIDAANNIVRGHVIFVPFSTDKTLLYRAEAYIMEKEYQKAADDLNLWYTNKDASRKNAKPIVLTPQDISDYYLNTSSTTRPLYYDINPKFTVEEGLQKGLIYAILWARRVEGVHEGIRWIDIKRYGIEVTHEIFNEEPRVLTVDDPRRAIQIPTRVIDAGMPANPR